MDGDASRSRHIVNGCVVVLIGGGGAAGLVAIIGYIISVLIR